MRSIPKILIRIKREKGWLGHFVAREGLDLIISDNRYGLSIPGIPCIFVTHQLLIKTPFGPWADRRLQALNYRIIRRFSRCWIPDIAIGGLAGDLSHPERMPSIPTRYIGWLSRFGSPAAGDSSDPGIVQGKGRAPIPVDRGHAGAPSPLLLVLLSGPEPQRTLLEKDIFRQAQALADKPSLCRLVIVRGVPGERGSTSHLPASSALALPSWVNAYDHLNARALEPLLEAASLVLARPGYSTVMDLERLGKRAIFIPTPGQTEQEYLGPYLAAKGWAACVDQRVFSLAKALEMAAATTGDRERQPEEPGLLAAEIKEVLNSLGNPAC